MCSCCARSHHGSIDPLWIAEDHGAMICLTTLRKRRAKATKATELTRRPASMIASCVYVLCPSRLHSRLTCRAAMYVLRFARKFPGSACKVTAFRVIPGRPAILWSLPRAVDAARIRSLPSPRLNMVHHRTDRIQLFGHSALHQSSGQRNILSVEFVPLGGGVEVFAILHPPS